MAYTKTEDTYGRQCSIPVLNEAEDGSGTDHRAIVDSSGNQKVVLVAGTAVVGKARLVTATGDEVTDDTADAVKTKDTDGAYTTPTHTAVNATTASGAALASNANRLYALVVNDSDTTIYIKLGADAVANQGIRLNAYGGAYEMSKKLGNLYTGAINCIHASTGNKVLLVTEGV